MIYRKYVGREVLLATLLILGAFMVLFAFFDLMGELGKLGEGGYKLYQAIVYVALIQPGRIYELMPICVLIGTLYALSNLARHSEINVLRCVWRLQHAIADNANACGLLAGAGHLSIGGIRCGPGRAESPGMARKGHERDDYPGFAVRRLGEG